MFSNIIHHFYYINLHFCSASDCTTHPPHLHLHTILAPRHEADRIKYCNFAAMKRLYFACLAIFLLIIYSPCSAQEQSSTMPTASYKTYHGDGIDNVLQYVPTAAVFGLKILGVEGESTWKRRLTVSLLSFGVNAGVTYTLKHTIKETRPDGTDQHSFPSGHTAIAFCGATTLMHEYKHVSPWIGIAGYAVATGVAIDRVRRNRHHWYDVAAGAAIGVASAEFGYWIGDKILGTQKKSNDLSLSVAPTGLEFRMAL